MKTLDHVLWSQAQLGKAIWALARANGLAPQAVAVANPSILRADDDAQTGVWIDHMARHLGLEAEAASLPYGQLETFLSQGGPTIVRLPGGDRPCFLALLGGRGRVRVVTPGGAVQSVPRDVVHAALCESLEAPHHEMIEDVLHAAGVPIRRQVKVRRAMLRSALTHASIPNCWYLRRPASAPARTLVQPGKSSSAVWIVV